MKFISTVEMSDVLLQVHRMEGMHAHKHNFPSFSSGLFSPAASIGASRSRGGKKQSRRRRKSSGVPPVAASAGAAMPMSSSETM